MILGIDTSCYTTSLALAEEGRLIDSVRQLLPVAKGSGGLRQNEAFFLHIKRLPALFEQLIADRNYCLTGVCVSAAPRRAEGSYMPVFCAGLHMAELLAAQAKVPLYTTTHQEGHLAAALYGSSVDSERFLALHLSGGTTELLQVRREQGGFETKLLGTADLAAGQMVDRIGVLLELPFPCGRHMESIARQGSSCRLPIAVQGMNISFSGPETAARRLFAQGEQGEHIAYAVFECIAKSLDKSIRQAVKQTGIKEIILAGGVASNAFIRDYISNCKAYRAVFAAAELASDNAVGVALLGTEKERI